jgi:hypothetical protein
MGWWLKSHILQLYVVWKHIVARDSFEFVLVSFRFSFLSTSFLGSGAYSFILIEYIRWSYLGRYSQLDLSRLHL